MNAGKLAALDDLAQVYLPLCQQYVTLFCTDESPDKFRATCFATPLSERWQRVAIQQAAGIAKSWRTNRANAYQHKGNYDQAIADFNEAIRVYHSNNYPEAKASFLPGHRLRHVEEHDGLAQSAHRAGMRCLAIAHSYGPERLRSAGPEWVIDSIADFVSWLEKEVSK